MRNFAGWLVMVLVAWGSGGPAAAQVNARDLRLFVDGALVTWDKRLEQLRDPQFPEDDYDNELKTTTSGPFSQGGVGVGFAALPSLIPQVYFSLQNVKLQLGDEPAKLRKFELRPALEVALLPATSWVPFVVGGLALAKLVNTDRDEGGEYKESTFGLGPVLGAGLHAFLVDHASLDLSLAFRGVFFVSSTYEKDLAGGADYDLRQYSIVLNLGASFWLRTSRNRTPASDS